MLANFCGLIVTGASGILVLPLYLRYLGAEAYGLVGFFVVLQQWFVLLDMGLGPTLSREVARYQSASLNASALGRIVRSMEWAFFGLALIPVVTITLSADWLAASWLKMEGLPRDHVSLSLLWISLIIGLRLFSGLYRGVLVGLERQVRLNAVQVGITVVRTFGALVLFEWFSKDVRVFFVFQFLLSVLEVVLLRAAFSRAEFMLGAGWRADFSVLVPLFRLAGGLAYITVLWTLISQADKLLLSNFLSLQSFGYFSSAVLLAGAVSMLAIPATQALQPRLAALAAQGKHEELVRLYRLSAQCLSALVIAAATVLVFMGREVLLYWTGDEALALQMAGVLGLYAAGNAVVALLALAFQLQFALGKTRLHVWGNTIFALFWLPAIPWCASQFGAIGVGCAWLVGNVLFYCLWSPGALQRVFPLLRANQVRGDFMATALACVAGAWLLSLLPAPENRWLGFVWVFAAFCMTSCFGVCAGGLSRQLMLSCGRRLMGSGTFD